MTPKELEDEKIVASIFKRPKRDYILDTPTYPFFPWTPLANFDLNYKE